MVANESFFAQSSVFLDAGIAGYVKFKKCCSGQKKAVPQGVTPEMHQDKTSLLDNSPAIALHNDASSWHISGSNATMMD